MAEGRRQSPVTPAVAIASPAIRMAPTPAPGRPDHDRGRRDNHRRGRRSIADGGPRAAARAADGEGRKIAKKVAPRSVAPFAGAALNVDLRVRGDALDDARMGARRTAHVGYLPKEWTDDPQRCHKAGIPESEQVFKTKNQLALEIVEQARRNGVRFGWVGADAGYGSGPDFLFALEDGGHTFLVDVHKSFVVYELDPQPAIAVLSSKGPKARRSITGKKGLSVEALVESCSAKDWRICEVRDTTRGSLKLRVLRKSVEVWDKQSEQARRYELLVTENMDGEDRKYSLTNEKPSTSTQRLSWMQRQRYWVERCFEDGKGQCGMADYQVRLWNAWHHHMALVMMAMLFMLTEKLRMKDQCPLLSCADIEKLLAVFLPRRDASPEQVYSHMKRRHEMRRRAIESHAKRSARRRSKVT